MKGGINLGDFIHDVKRELIAAQNKSGDPFYVLDEVRLEVSFVLDASAKAGGKFLVVEVGGETKGQQTHKVSLTLRPPIKPGFGDPFKPGFGDPFKLGFGDPRNTPRQLPTRRLSGGAKGKKPSYK